MTAQVLIPAIAIAGVLLGVLVGRWQSSRSRDLLGRWAHDHGYRVVSAERAYFRRGPYFWTTSEGQTIYRVVVSAGDGDRIEGWARCGGFWGGLWSDRVEVRLDEPRPGIERVFE